MNFTSHLFLTNGSWGNVTEQDSDHYSDQGLLELHRAYTIWRYVSPFLILLGTFGNVFTIVILCRKSIWKLASSPYLAVLCVADVTVLYLSLLRQWIIYLTGLDIRLTSSVVCKLHTTLVYTTTDFSVWILVAVSVERFICVCFPFKAKSICSRGRAKIVMVVLLLLLFSINCHFLFGFGSVYDEDSGELISHCMSLNSDYDTFLVNVWPWIDLSMFSMIPFIIIIMCNITLMTKISRSWRRNKVLPGDEANLTRVKSSSMAPLLVSLNSMFLITTAPICIFLIGYPKWVVNATKDDEARLDLWWSIVNQLMYLNNTVNFIFYCVSGPQFRQELKAMLQRRNTVIPTRTLRSNQQAPVKPSVCDPSPPGQPSRAHAASNESKTFPSPLAASHVQPVRNNTTGQISFLTVSGSEHVRD